MAYTYQQLPTGKVDILENGKSIAQGGPGFDLAYAQKMGATPMTAPAPVASPLAPQPQKGGPGSLTAFSDSLSQAVNLARQHRNSLSLNMMAPYQGTLAASDFNSILGNMNAASDTTAQDLIKNATAAAQPTKLTEVSPGATLYDPTTGKSVYTAPTTKSQNGDDPGNGSTGATMSTDQIKKLKQALDDSKFQGTEADGKYVDPALYLQNYESWLAHGGSPEYFFRNFPPGTYLNPKNTSLPPDVLKFVPKPKSDLENPFAK